MDFGPFSLAVFWRLSFKNAKHVSTLTCTSKTGRLATRFGFGRKQQRHIDRTPLRPSVTRWLVVGLNVADDVRS